MTEKTPYCRTWHSVHGEKGSPMAFDNKSIRPILENEELSIKDKVNQLQTLHHEIVNGLMDEKDEAIQRAEKAEKAAESAKAEKEAAEKSLTDYKTQQTQKDTRATKAAAYKQLLKDNGVLEKHFDRVVKMTGADIDALELDENGKVKNAKKFMDSQKDVWGDFVATTTTTGAKVDNPPTNTGSKMTKEQIINIKDASERQAAIAANPEAFGLAAKE
nr:MAG TPA: minor structural protein [Caudoviricetes sp.]